MFTKGKCKEYGDSTLFECDLEFRDAFAYTQQYKYSYLIKEKQTIEVENLCSTNKFYYSTINIEFFETGVVEITNTITLDKSLVQGEKNEIVNINCNREIVVSDKKDYKYVDIEGFIKFKYGINIMEIKGQCKIEFICRYPMLME